MTLKYFPNSTLKSMFQRTRKYNPHYDEGRKKLFEMDFGHKLITHGCKLRHQIEKKVLILQASKFLHHSIKTLPCAEIAMNLNSLVNA